MQATLITLLTLLVCLSSLAAPPESNVRLPDGDQILATLKPTHPRLIASADDFTKLRDLKNAHPLYKAIAAEILRNADTLLDKPVVEHEIPDGKRLLATSRAVLARSQYLAMAYHLTGDRKYVDRLYIDLHAAAAFADWNPDHFLDTAEMTAAFAWSYDWLYDQWTPAQRDEIRSAMVRLGLNAGLEAYAKKVWWTNTFINWNQVCNGGLILGALAIADEEPKIAVNILQNALPRYRIALRHFAPEGGWDEGPDYWHYAMDYTAAPLAAMDSALGTDFGLSDTPGLSQAGRFILYMVGPFNFQFNFADGQHKWDGAPALWWLAKRFDQPILKSFQREQAHKHAKPLDLLWADMDINGKLPPATPPDAYFRKVEVATFRTAWNDADAMFVGFKAGDNTANHGHLDLGSFVLDDLGQRWAWDLGSDDYNLPDYFGRQRWTYYRLRAEGHNTLLVGPDKGPEQNPKADCKITRYESDADRGFAIADLSTAYPKAKSVKRGLGLFDRGERPYVLIQDEITTPSPTTVWWAMHTHARIAFSPDKRTATLTLTDKRIDKDVSLIVRLLSPANATFKNIPPKPLASSPHPPKQATEDSWVKKLAIEMPEVGATTLVVQITRAAAPADAPKVVPLDEWK